MPSVYMNTGKSESSGNIGNIETTKPGPSGHTPLDRTLVNRMIYDGFWNASRRLR